MEEKPIENGDQMFKNDSEGDVGSLSSEIPPLALGPYGDIPASYAVLHIDIDRDAGVATDARYVFASEGYSRALRRANVGLVGRSHLEVGEVDAGEWLSRCYRAVVDGETISGFEYDPLVRSWVCYALAPSAVEGCCVYMFVTVTIDEDQRRKLIATADARTSLVISEMLSALSAEQSYEAAMDGMLKMMSEVIQTDRLMIFECSEKEAKVTFELCAEGVAPQIGMVYALPKAALKHWFRSVSKDPVVLVPDISILENFNKELYKWCVASGVKSLMAAPFFNDGEIVGFLGAYNYQIDEEVDLNRLFSAVSSFIGARIDNRRLIESLAWAGDHDALTNLLNRRGVRKAIDERLADQPDGSHVLAIVDIDDFKRINDVYGHKVGDAAICTLANCMTESFPDGTILSRHGGDEFLVMFSGEAAENADNLLAGLSEQRLQFEHEGTSHPITLSIGYVCYPIHAREVNDLYAKADAALYGVKLAGKAGFGRYMPNVAAQYRSKLGFTARDIIDSVPYPMAVHKADEESAILFASVSFVRLLGFNGMYDLVRASDGTFTGIVHPDDRARVAAALAEQASGDGHAKAVIDFRALMKDGTARDVHAICNFVEIEEAGEVFYTILEYRS